MLFHNGDVIVYMWNRGGELSTCIYNWECLSINLDPLAYQTILCCTSCKVSGSNATEFNLKHTEQELINHLSSKGWELETGLAF